MKVKIQEGSDFMTEITAILMSLLTTLSLFFGCAGSTDYQKQSGLSEAVNSLINKDSILTSEYKGEASDYKWSENDEYKLVFIQVLDDFINETRKDDIVANF